MRGSTLALRAVVGDPEIHGRIGSAAEIRELFKEGFGEGSARALPILDGGSVNAANAATLMCLPDIDGGLIGHASLMADEYLSILRSAV